MRTLGRNITRVDRWSKDIFSETVEYKAGSSALLYVVALTFTGSSRCQLVLQDNFRSFKGRAKYSRLRFHRDCLSDPRAVRVACLLYLLGPSAAQHSRWTDPLTVATL